MTAPGITFRECTDDESLPTQGASDSYWMAYESRLDRAMRSLEEAQSTVYHDGYDPGPVPEHLLEPAPLESYTAAAEIKSPDELELEERKPLSDLPTSRILDLTHLETLEPPPFYWWVPGWLSPHPTLLSGRGGVGKSLLALQLAIGCAAGKPLIGKASKPLNVLYWACEDDTDELHRRMVAISSALNVGLGELAGRLHVDARLGLDNTILATEYGRPAWTPRVEILRQQLNDLQIDLLILDNLAHVFAASENDRAAVTMFTAGLCGLVLERPWCPMLIGHVAKAQGSEYAGSTAWENAVRMRWFLGKNLPDAQDDETETDGDLRVLAKRKSNYSADDVIRLRVGDRRFTVDEPTDDGTVIGAIREKNVRKAVIDAIQTLRARNIDSSEQYSRAYLPALMVQYSLTQGHSKKELERAMRQLLMSGNIRREIVGKKANRMPREGLVVVDDAAQ